MRAAVGCGMVRGADRGPPRPRRHVACGRELRAVHGRRARRGGRRGRRGRASRTAPSRSWTRPWSRSGAARCCVHRRPDIACRDERHPRGRSATRPALAGRGHRVLRRRALRDVRRRAAARRTPTGSCSRCADPVAGCLWLGRPAGRTAAQRLRDGCASCRGILAQEAADLRRRSLDPATPAAVARRQPESPQSGPGPRGLAFAMLRRGEVSEWLMVPLSKSGVRKHRGFESHPLRHRPSTRTRSAGSSSRPRRGRLVAEGAALEMRYGATHRGFESLPLRHFLPSRLVAHLGAPRRYSLPAYRVSGIVTRWLTHASSSADRIQRTAVSRSCSRASAPLSRERVRGTVRFGAKLSHSTQPTPRERAATRSASPHPRTCTWVAVEAFENGGHEQGAQGRHHRQGPHHLVHRRQLHASRSPAPGPATTRPRSCAAAHPHLRQGHPVGRLRRHQRRRLQDPDLQR